MSDNMSRYMSKKLSREYSNLLFRRHWDLTPKALLLLGQCEAYFRAINNTPILPHLYRDLMNVALMKGA